MAFGTPACCAVDHFACKAGGGSNYDTASPFHSKRLELSTGMRQFDVVIERDEEGFYAGSVPQFPGCHTQGRSLDELMDRMREAVELCLEVEGTPTQALEFIGIQRITIAA
jgi:predicted RNase H-like HicB family nuclease